MTPRFHLTGGQGLKSLIKKLLPRSIEHKLRKFVKRPAFIQNINHDPSVDQDRVLLSYVIAPLERPLESVMTHSNQQEVLMIIKALIDLNFSIDVAYCLDDTNTSTILQKHYDLILGFGSPFLSYSQVNPKCLKVIYLTEASPDFSRRQEEERDAYFFQRHKKHMLDRRTGRYFTNEQLNIADAAILIGNEFVKETYVGLPYSIHTIFPTAMENPNFVPYRKHHEETRKCFLWFGSSGAVHKGLDILVDVFSLPENSDLTLFVCGLKGSERKLFDFKHTKNIIDLGFVQVLSNEFLTLLEKCTYVILPSCSEGVATSVATCMNHGLIPVVTKGTGFDRKDFVVHLQDYHVEYVSEVVRECANRSVRDLEAFEREAIQYARTSFSKKAFKKNFLFALQKILAEHNLRSNDCPYE